MQGSPLLKPIAGFTFDCVITLTTKVKSTPLGNERTRKDSIHIESDHGNVTIDGRVGSRSKAKYVGSVVAAVSGVRTVQNKLSWPTS
jgi:osmotically-inducible protein OsmY